MSDFDGNTSQVRLIAGQIATAMEEARDGSSWRKDIEALKKALEQDIDSKIDAAVTRMKFWVISAVLTQVITFLPVIFFLGGIYTSNNQALELMQKQQTVLEKRGAWMNERERWEQGIEQWAGPQGFVPPRYKATGP